MGFSFCWKGAYFIPYAIARDTLEKKTCAVVYDH